jgi:hypothetical protein
VSCSLIKLRFVEWPHVEKVGDTEVSVPFELHVYEMIFSAVRDIQKQIFARIEKDYNRVVSHLSKGTMLPLELQEDMRKLKNELSSLSSEISLHRTVLENLMEKDEDMVLMNLSMLKNDPRLYRHVLFYYL